MPTTLLSANNLTKSYGRKHVLTGVTFEVQSGTLIGVVGENGSGKSTLLQILAGELAASRGDVMVDGSLGYCPQAPVLNASLTVNEHLAYFQSAYRLPDLKYAGHLLSQLRCDKFKDELVGNLSGGTRQKLNLALALMHQPSILLLDEPYQGFDWETYLRFWGIVKQLKQAGKAIIIISHLIYEQKQFDSILQLHDGKIREAVS